MLYVVKKKLSKTILRLFALLVNRRENICSFRNLQISDTMRDDTTTQLKLCVCRVAFAVILSGDIFLFVAKCRLVA